MNLKYRFRAAHTPNKVLKTFQNWHLNHDLPEGLTTLHLGVRRFKSENGKYSGFSGIFGIFKDFWIFWTLFGLFC